MTWTEGDYVRAWAKPRSLNQKNTGIITRVYDENSFEMLPDGFDTTFRFRRDQYIETISRGGLEALEQAQARKL